MSINNYQHIQGKHMKHIITLTTILFAIVSLPSHSADFGDTTVTNYPNQDPTVDKTLMRLVSTAAANRDEPESYLNRHPTVYISFSEHDGGYLSVTGIATNNNGQNFACYMSVATVGAERFARMEKMALAFNNGARIIVDAYSHHDGKCASLRIAKGIKYHLN